MPASLGTVSSDDELAALAAEFTGWHIWRSRSASGALDGWRATRRKWRRGPSGAGGGRLAAADAGGLRALLVQEEALVAV
jgi:hypothetical protein